MLRVNLGCGTNPLPDWVNIDLVQAPGVQHVLDLDRDRLPLEPGSVDAFRMIHVIEHLKNPLHCMEEAWRAAKHGAPIEIRCPHGASNDAWEDPTHVRAMFPVSFGYFSQPFYWRADYGYRGDWRIHKVQLIVTPEAFHEFNREPGDWPDGTNIPLEATTERFDPTRDDAGPWPARPRLLQAIDRHRNLVREIRCIMTAQKPARDRRKELQEPIPIEIAIAR